MRPAKRSLEPEPGPHRHRRWLDLAIILCPLLLMPIQGLAAATSPQALAFAISLNSPPLAFKRGGVVKGLEVDLARALAAALERELSLHALPEPRLIDALRGGRVDILLSALPGEELTALGLTASTPVLDSGQMAIIRTEDLARFPRVIDLKLTDERVGYQRASLGARLVQARLPRAERVPFADATAAIAALRAREITVFIHDATTAWALAANPNETELTGLFRPLSREQLRFVTRSEETQLQRELAQVLDEWRRSGELERMIRRWIPIQIRISDDLNR
ncbi:substrate-binding periplasmic protein [Halochromatium sp.]